MAELRARAWVLEKRQNKLAKLGPDLAATQAGRLEGYRLDELLPWSWRPADVAINRSA